uniref:Putative secreted protein n=1 Tax=Anopheles darlingi TaxID=43151 RepID=A0A2M4D8W3_ANODA
MPRTCPACTLLRVVVAFGHVTVIPQHAHIDSCAILQVQGVSKCCCKQNRGTGSSSLSEAKKPNQTKQAHRGSRRVIVFFFMGKRFIPLANSYPKFVLERLREANSAYTTRVARWRTVVSPAVSQTAHDK